MLIAMRRREHIPPQLLLLLLGGTTAVNLFATGNSHNISIFAAILIFDKTQTFRYFNEM